MIILQAASYRYSLSLIYHISCNEICVIAVMGSIKMKMRLSQGSKESKVAKNSSV